MKTAIITIIAAFIVEEAYVVAIYKGFLRDTFRLGRIFKRLKTKAYRERNHNAS